jgi:hypothetical protein
MKKTLTLIALATLFSAPAFAADPVVGTWKLNLEKSKFAGAALKSATRTYSEAQGLYTLEQKLVTAEGKEVSSRATYRDGKEEKQAANAAADSTLAKKLDARTWDFELKKDGQVVGHVHRSVSADGKVLTVHNSGAKLSGATGDETLVFDKQ